MKKRPTPIWFYDPIYRENFYIFYLWDAQKIEAWISENHGVKIELNDDAAAGTYKQGCCTYLRLTTPVDSPKGMQELVHEVTHAALWGLSWRGVVVSGEQQEPLAYYEGWITREILERLKVFKKRRR